MRSFRVELDETSHGAEAALKPAGPVYRGVTILKPMPGKPFAIVVGVLSAILIFAGVAGLLYYRSLRDTPQYSLALLIDAAKRDDKNDINALMDIDTVVDDFVPQVTGKAVELYGRGQPPQVLAQVAKIAEPILPAVKDRARMEVPRVIRDRTKQFGYVPFFAMVIGAQKYLDITVTGDMALVRSKVPDHPLEMVMRRSGANWQIVGIKDEQLATDIARRIGQEIIAVAMTGGPKSAVNKFGIGNLSDLIKQAEELVR
ncbi:MAG: hypothetical protein ABIV21_09595 [Pyrinomonadaceae bacterium]